MADKEKKELLDEMKRQRDIESAEPALQEVLESLDDWTGEGDDVEKARYNVARGLHDFLKEFPQKEAVNEYALAGFLEAAYGIYTFGTDPGQKVNGTPAQMYNLAVGIVAETLGHYYDVPADILTKRLYDTDVKNYFKAIQGPQGTPLARIISGPVLNSMREVLNYDGDLLSLQEHKNAQGKGNDYRVSESGSSRRIETPTASLEFENINNVAKGGKDARTIFTMALTKINDQAIWDGSLTQDYITFPLQELVDNGAYYDIHAARKAFKRGLSAISEMKAYTDDEKGGSFHFRVLFTGGDIDNGQCIIELNKNVNWASIAKFYNLYPTFYYKLPSRAQDLLDYIFYLARQHSREIEKSGYFTISYRAIQGRLDLPIESKTRNPSRDILDPIEKAVEEIEAENKETLTSKQFQLLPVEKGNKISEILDKSKLKVIIKGDLAKEFISLSRQTKKKKQAAEQRKERVQEKIAMRAAEKPAT